MRRILIGSSAIIILVLAACVPPTPVTRDDLSRSFEERTGASLAPPAPLGEMKLPPGISLDDGLTEDDAVAIALWNNASFRADLSDLALARAALTEAGQIPNPIVSFLYLFGVKGRESYVLWPLDALVQMPSRVKAAKLDVRRVADDLLRRGLVLARDTQIAFIALDSAERLAKIAAEGFRVRGGIAEIAAARLKAGDVSGIEESAARLDALQAENESRNARREAEAARIRLAEIMGFGDVSPGFVLSPKKTGEAAIPPVDQAPGDAYVSRPELRAAQFEIEAAAARLGWERARILKLTATLDAKEKGEAGIFSGPSAKLEIPIFNRNEGGTARAKAAMEQAAARYAAVRQMIGAEVRQAIAELDAAGKAEAVLRTAIAPAAKEAAFRARKAYEAGEESYLFCLEAERRALEAEKQAAAAQADVRRAEVRLAYAVGFSKPSADNTGK